MAVEIVPTSFGSTFFSPTFFLLPNSSIFTSGDRRRHRREARARARWPTAELAARPWRGARGPRPWRSRWRASPLGRSARGRAGGGCGGPRRRWSLARAPGGRPWWVGGAGMVVAVGGGSRRWGRVEDRWGARVHIVGLDELLMGF
jgi:hypothetical protein